MGEVVVVHEAAAVDVARDAGDAALAGVLPHDEWDVVDELGDVGVVAGYHEHVVGEVVSEVVVVEAGVCVEDGTEAIVVLDLLKELLEAGAELLLGDALDVFDVDDGYEVHVVEVDVAGEVAYLFWYWHTW